MIIEVKVPSPGESITQVQLASWLVEDGDFIEKDSEIAEIDSDKATLSISAEESGLIKILVQQGETIEVGSVVATINTDAIKPVAEIKKTKSYDTSKQFESAISDVKVAKEIKSNLLITPLAKKVMDDKNISEKDLSEVDARHRIYKKDIDNFESSRKNILTGTKFKSREAKRQKLSTLRIKLAERLVAVKNQTAMLTTFNEIDMSHLIEIRNKYKESFQNKYGIKLGFMSFFTKATAEALQEFPQVNSLIDVDEMVIPSYVDIGIAVSAPKGLVVPIIRNVESLSLPEIEQDIFELAEKARINKISLDEMTGGTFTITNGGVFGSMLSTPIINPPQSAILGMHNIIERPVAIKGKVEIRPMMYVALSYDHRIIDGRESVSFLIKIKELLENPIQLLYGSEDPMKNLLGL